MDIRLTAEEVRVLGCLLEKKMATPEYYPLTLNALVNACNQKVNRTPVVCYDEVTVQTAAEGLRRRQLLWINTSGRVAKNAEGLVERFELSNDQAALICVLLLRGPQTVGELRSRAERLFGFDDLAAVHQTLDGLVAQGFIEQAARQPSQKETRFRHLLGNDEETPAMTVSSEPQKTRTPARDRLAELEEQVAQLAAEVRALQQTFDQFKEQFE